MIHNLHGSLCIDGRRWLPLCPDKKTDWGRGEKDKRLFIEGGIMDSTDRRRKPDRRTDDRMQCDGMVNQGLSP
ncbi:hypothetical protein AA18890_0733 [Komagataeibacter europaeus LMG 18890]|nr:hypothetical protein AA18890_0733 [Komagataeibacter europaeus LMG 18890]